jgi:hypothetical protein
LGSPTSSGLGAGDLTGLYYLATYLRLLTTTCAGKPMRDGATGDNGSGLNECSVESAELSTPTIELELNVLSSDDISGAPS